MIHNGHDLRVVHQSYDHGPPGHGLICVRCFDKIMRVVGRNVDPDDFQGSCRVLKFLDAPPVIPEPAKPAEPLLLMQRSTMQELRNRARLLADATLNPSAKSVFLDLFKAADAVDAALARTQLEATEA